MAPALVPKRRRGDEKENPESPANAPRFRHVCVCEKVVLCERRCYLCVCVCVSTCVLCVCVYVCVGVLCEFVFMCVCENMRSFMLQPKIAVACAVTINRAFSVMVVFSF